MNIADCAEPAFMQTSNVGGWSVTLHIAVAVNPPRPAGPLLVITLTGAQTRAMALRNSTAETSVSTVSMMPSYSAAWPRPLRVSSGSSQVSPVQPCSS